MEATAHAAEFTFPEEYTGHTMYRESPFHIIEDVRDQRLWHRIEGVI